MIKNPEIRKYILNFSVAVMLAIAMLGCAKKESMPQTIIPLTQTHESTCGSDIPVGQFVGETHRDGNDLQVFGCMNPNYLPESIALSYLYLLNGEISPGYTGAVILPGGFVSWAIPGYFGDQGAMSNNAIVRFNVDGQEFKVNCPITASGKDMDNANIQMNCPVLGMIW